MDCHQYTVIPTLPSDPCNRERKSTNCIIYPTAITYLGLSSESTATQVIDNLLLSLVDARNRVQLLETQINNATLPYKVYRALLTQTSTSAPTSTIIENTLSGDIVWTRNSPGNYTGTLTGEFLLGKTFYPTYGSTNGLDRFFMHRIDDNTFKIYTLSYDEIASLDDLLYNTPIEIIVYN